MNPIHDAPLPSIVGLYPIPFRQYVSVGDRVRVQGRWLDSVNRHTLLTDCTRVSVRALQIEPQGLDGYRTMLLTEFGIGSRPYFETAATEFDREQVRGLSVSRGLSWSFPSALELDASQSWYLEFFNAGVYPCTVSGALWVALPAAHWAGIPRLQGDAG